MRRAWRRLADFGFYPAVMLVMAVLQLGCAAFQAWALWHLPSPTGWEGWFPAGLALGVAIGLFNGYCYHRAVQWYLRLRRHRRTLELLQGRW